MNILFVSLGLSLLLTVLNYVYDYSIILNFLAVGLAIIALVSAIKAYKNKHNS